MRRLLIGFALLPLLWAAACNGDDDSGTANEQTPPPSIPGPVNDEGRGDATQGRVEVEAQGLAFEPTYIRATAGARVAVSLRNDTGTPHTFTMADQGVDQQLDPGATAQVTVTLPDDGPVIYVCRFHEAQGMKGAFFFG